MGTRSIDSPPSFFLLSLLKKVGDIHFQSQGGKDELHQIFQDWKRTTNTFVLQAIKGKLR